MYRQYLTSGIIFRRIVTIIILLLSRILRRARTYARESVSKHFARNVYLPLLRVTGACVMYESCKIRNKFMNTSYNYSDNYLARTMRNRRLTNRVYRRRRHFNRRIFVFLDTPCVTKSTRSARVPKATKNVPKLRQYTTHTTHARAYNIYNLY